MYVLSILVKQRKDGCYESLSAVNSNERCELNMEKLAFKHTVCYTIRVYFKITIEIIQV